MIRVIRGYIARRRRTKTRCVVSGFRGAHSRHTQMITQQKMRALAFSHRDRGNKKRDFRRLWITRINAVIHQHMLFHNYSQFIHYLRKNELVINRKILSQIAIFNRSCFFNIADSIYFNRNVRVLESSYLIEKKK